MRKWVVSILIALILGIYPASAQENSPLNWIPADFTGFVRLRADSTAARELTIATITASFLQPSRIDPNQFQGYETLIPLTMLDVEDVTFSQNILPWLNGEVILAYRQFGDAFQVAADDVLMILPTADVFRAATALGPIIQGQDLLKTEIYRGITLYLGDKSTIAIAPEAVLIGTRALVEAALDRRAGTGGALISGPAYKAVQTANREDSLVSAYFSGDNLLSALSVLLNGSLSARPLLSALGEGLREFRDEGSFETALLTDSVDGIGIDLRIVGDQERLMQATATFYTEGQTSPAVVSGEFNPSLLNMIPRSAMAVQSGSDVASLVYDSLTALPLVNFAGSMLGGFPVRPSQGALSQQITLPSSEDLQTAVSGFLDILDTIGGLNLDNDLLTYLAGSYAIALLPRPNDPAPVLNTPFDVLVLAEVNDSKAALAGVTKLLQTLFRLPELERETIDGTAFSVLRETVTGRAVIRIGVIDNLLVVATGNALEAALEARRGDNRLIDRDRWKSVSREETPQLFINLNSVYNTFFPTSGAPLLELDSLLAASGHELDGGLFQIEVMMTLPFG